VSIAPKSLSYSEKTVNITLIGGTTERTLSLSSTGSLFSVGSGVTLTLENNVTLQGLSNNTYALVQVNSGGTLVMASGSKITGNTASPSYSSSSGGGVYMSGGTFTMNGGEISGNTASSSDYNTYGGGVYMSGGTFTMNGGEISGNTASSSNSYAYGGGVYMSDGTFTMNGGEISGNTASSPNYYYASGGGVYVNSGTFIKESSGTIYGSDASDSLKNTASSGDDYGHAVFSGGNKRNSTAGADVTLNSSLSGSSGGWE
jgi:hypothetical protein